MNNELQIQIVQNLVPVLTADITIGGGQNITFGDTMTGAGTPTDPVNVSNDVLQQISDNTEQTQDNASQIADIQNNLSNIQGTVQNATEQISEIQSVIPATANAQNQLADQGFVNSSIQTSTAYFRGDWETWADVPNDPALYPVDANGNRTPTTNDYLVVIADEQTNGGTWRYKYTGLWSEQGKSGWQAEYQVNETPFTAAQNAAINSGVTAAAVADIATNKTAVATLQTSKQNKLTAGDGITIDGDTISATGGGDYLPLSGGTLTGGLKINSWFNSSKQLVITNKYSETSSSVYSWYFDVSSLGYVMTIGCITNVGTLNPVIQLTGERVLPWSNKITLGSASSTWKMLYVEKLNNGADLAVPTEGGTLARIEDIDAAVGDISTALTAILGE